MFERKPPDMVGLCPSDAHMGEFYVPLTMVEVQAGPVRCPECDQDLLVYRPAGRAASTGDADA